MSPNAEMFASDLIGNLVVDHTQETVGRIKDIILSEGDTFPKIAGLLITTEEGKKEPKILPMGEINLIGKKFVSTRVPKEEVSLLSPEHKNILLLMRDVIDQQVVDLEGARVIRVNDLQFAKVGHDVRLIAADIGLRSVLRRLGLEKFVGWILHLFHKSIPEQLISWNHVQSLAEGKVSLSSKGITHLHPADVAQIISQLNAENKTAILSLLSDKTAAEALQELEPMLAAVLIANLDNKKALNILEEMPLDAVADVLLDLSPEKSSALLAGMSALKSAQLRELLKHPDETAGGLMKTEFITLQEDMTSEQVIEKLRSIQPSAENIYYLYVVDAGKRLVGVLSLRNLIIAEPSRLISEIITQNPITVSPEMKQREVAAIISKYNMLAVPVIDEHKKILGIVTVDDVIDFILPPISKRKRKMLG
ncbi:MAG: hypothetical protein A3H42_06515 [Deltaproteobacteria bacterium RIFCSPLOWO2_02_FULL_46_8]|nr:MAG: hypothetical protein A3H42_06515 [Deltaproteobacteria bacterium RIFCSPLOWO2_02_FULL_46_8]